MSAKDVTEKKLIGEGNINVKMEIYQFKDDVLKDIKAMQKVVADKYEALNESITIKFNKYDDKLQILSDKIAELSKLISDDSDVKQKIESLESMQNKTKDNLLTLDIKTSNIKSEMRDNLNRVDKILCDSVIYPGMIGGISKFKTFHDFIDYCSTNISQLITYKDKNILDLKSYKVKLDTLIGSLKKQLDNIIESTNSFTTKSVNDCEERIKNILLIYDERIKDTRFENANFAKELSKSAEDVKKETEKIELIKKDIYDKFEHEAYLIREDNKETAQLFGNYKSEFYIMKDRLTQLATFIKDVRFRHNLGHYIPKKEYNNMAKKIDFKRRQELADTKFIESNEIFNEDIFYGEVIENPTNMDNNNITDNVMKNNNINNNNVVNNNHNQIISDNTSNNHNIYDENGNNKIINNNIKYNKNNSNFVLNNQNNHNNFNNNISNNFSVITHGSNNINNNLPNSIHNNYYHNFNNNLHEGNISRGFSGNEAISGEISRKKILKEIKNKKYESGLKRYIKGLINAEEIPAIYEDQKIRKNIFVRKLHQNDNIINNQNNINYQNSQRNSQNINQSDIQIKNNINNKFENIIQNDQSKKTDAKKIVEILKEKSDSDEFYTDEINKNENESLDYNNSEDNVEIKNNLSLGNIISERIYYNTDDSSFSKVNIDNILKKYSKKNNNDKPNKINNEVCKKDERNPNIKNITPNNQEKKIYTAKINKSTEDINYKKEKIVNFKGIGHYSPENKVFEKYENQKGEINKIKKNNKINNYDINNYNNCNLLNGSIHYKQIDIGNNLFNQNNYKQNFEKSNNLNKNKIISNSNSSSNINKYNNNFEDRQVFHNKLKNNINLSPNDKIDIKIKNENKSPSSNSSRNKINNFVSYNNSFNNNSFSNLDPNNYKQEININKNNNKLQNNNSLYDFNTKTNYSRSVMSSNLHNNQKNQSVDGKRNQNNLVNLPKNVLKYYDNKKLRPSNSTGGLINKIENKKFYDYNNNTNNSVFLNSGAPLSINNNLMIKTKTNNNNFPNIQLHNKSQDDNNTFTVKQKNLNLSSPFQIYQQSKIENNVNNIKQNIGKYIVYDNKNDTKNKKNTFKILPTFNIKNMMDIKAKEAVILQNLVNNLQKNITQNENNFITEEEIFQNNK